MAQRIGIFCSASGGIDPLYFDAARRLGEWMGRHGKTLVFGGSSAGLMGAIARAAADSGGRTVGVVPQLLIDRGMLFEGLHETFVTHSLSERKEILLRESDLLVVLPGGVGTLDEVFHVLASATIGYHAKRVVFYNVNNFWTPLLAYLQQLGDSGFVRAATRPHYTSAETPRELEALLNE